MEGIIIKSMDYKDTSKLVTIVTSSGVSTLLVKGAKQYKSKNFAYSQVLTFLSYEPITSKTFDIIGSASIIDSFSNVKKDYERTQAAYIVLEHAYQFAEHITDTVTFFEFLKNILYKINESKNFDLYQIMFRLKLLYLLGIGPIFSECISCQTKENLRGFDLYGGGVKCANHVTLQDFLYSENTISKIKYIYLVKLDQVSEDLLNQVQDIKEQLEDFLLRYYEHYLGYRSRVQKIYQKI